MSILPHRPPAPYQRLGGPRSRTIGLTPRNSLYRHGTAPLRYRRRHTLRLPPARDRLCRPAKRALGERHGLRNVGPGKLRWVLVPTLRQVVLRGGYLNFDIGRSGRRCGGRSECCPRRRGRRDRPHGRRNRKHSDRGGAHPIIQKSGRGVRILATSEFMI